MSERIGASFLLIVFVTSLIMFFNLGGLPLLDPDEPVYAETPKEMIEFNDYLSPRIYGEYWYDKPPMYYWLVAASFKIFGVNEFSARFPSALLAVVCVLYVYFAGSRLFNQRAGMAGALVLATSIEFFYLGKAAVTDMTLNLFLTVALLAFLEKRYYLFYICAGLATVTKGPVGLLFPGAVIFLYLLITRNFSEILRMKLPVGILLYALFGLPWYVFMYKVHGNAFIETFLGFHNITRFTSPEHPEGVLWYYFIPVLLLGFLPWTAVMCQAVWAAVTGSRSQYKSLIFLVIWAAFIFLFFTASRTKLVSYILPMFPPLAMIVGWYIDHIWDARRGSRPIAWPLLLTIFGGLFCAALFFAAETMPGLFAGAVVTAVIFAGMIIGVWYFTRRWEFGRAFWLQITAMTLFSIVLMTMLFPQAAPAFHSKDIAKQFTAHYDGKAPVYIIKFLHPGFTFYTGIYGTEVKVGQLAEAVGRSGKAYFVLRKPDYDSLNEAQKKQLTTLAVSDEKILLLKP
jgi:4-amino-4-deoxy-L-arabinose transferase-like glycosyltransferase